MNKIKKGSVVIKKSDKNKIIFIVEKIKVEQKKKIAILKGVYVRINRKASCRRIRAGRPKICK